MAKLKRESIIYVNAPMPTRQDVKKMEEKTLSFIGIMIVPFVFFSYSMQRDLSKYFFSLFGLLFWLCWIGPMFSICAKKIEKHMYFYYNELSIEEKMKLLKPIWITMPLAFVLVAYLEGRFGFKWWLNIIIFLAPVSAIKSFVDDIEEMENIVLDEKDAAFKTKTETMSSKNEKTDMDETSDGKSQNDKEVPERVMVYCSHCGEKLGEGQLFCYKCGAEIN